MSSLIAIALKDLRLLARDRAALFFALGWPVLTAVLFGVLFSGSGSSPRARVVFADGDRSAESVALRDALRALDAVTLDEADEARARELVRTGQRAAAIVVPRGYGEAAERLFHGAPPVVDLVIDPSRKAEQAMLGGLLQQVAGQRLSTVFAGGESSTRFVAQAREQVRGLPEAERAPFETLFDAVERLNQAAPMPAPGTPEGGWSPIEVRVESVQAKRRGPANAFAVTFPQGMLWALVGCMMAFAGSLVTESQQGTLLRLKAAPLPPWMVLAGKALACFLAIVAALGTLALLAVLLFKVQPTSVPLLLAAIGCIAFAFTGLMMLVAGFGRTAAATSGIGWAVMMPLMMLGGGMVPVFLMPGWMQQVGSISPVKWATLALEGAIWRGFSLVEVLPAFGVLLAVGAIAGGFGAWRAGRRATA